jgi:hypothetical protein
MRLGPNTSLIKHDLGHRWCKSLVDAVYSSGKPLVTKQRIGRPEDTKICCENASETYEDIRIFPSLANYDTVLPCPITAHDDPFFYLRGRRLRICQGLGPLDSVSESTTPHWGYTIGRYIHIPRV